MRDRVHTHKQPMIECTDERKDFVNDDALGHASAHGRTDDAAHKFRTTDVRLNSPRLREVQS
jgi:hypothetical protein